MIRFPSDNGRSVFERGQGGAAFLQPPRNGPNPVAQQQPDGIGTGRSAGEENADVYPGHSAFLALLEQLASGVRGNAIGADLLSRAALAQRLAGQFFGASTAAHSNAEWMTVPGRALGFDEAAVAMAAEAALVTPVGFADGSRWAVWAGTHVGTFYVSKASFLDVAVWQTARTEPTQIPADVNATPPDQGQPRQYALQPVSWWNLDKSPARLKRTGWNQSHREVPYIWGWDPKDRGDRKGKIGAHLGYPFTLGSCEWIIWVCFGEVFLECVQVSATRTATINGRSVTGRPKTSTRDLPGWGQWLIEDRTTTPPG